MSVLEGAELVDDAVGVTVTLKIVGTTVGTDMTDVPDRVVMVLVKEEVVRERDVEGAGEEVAEVERDDEELDWAAAGLRRARMATADHAQRRRGSMADGGKGKEGKVVVG